MMKKIVGVMALAAASAVMADVTVTIAPTLLGLTDQNDATIAEADGFFMLVADVNGDGLDGYANGEIDFTTGLVSDDDVVLYTGAFAADSTATGVNSPATYTGVTGGEDYYAIWSNTGASTTDIGENNYFGVYRFDDANWDVPATGTVGPLVMDVNEAGASYYQSIPEPATFALLGIAGMGAFLGRRRFSK